MLSALARKSCARLEVKKLLAARTTLADKRNGLRSKASLCWKENASRMDEQIVPPAIPLEKVDFEQFKETWKVLGIKIKRNDIGVVMGDIKNCILRLKKQKNVIDSEGSTEEKVILFSPTIKSFQDLESLLEGKPVLEELKRKMLGQSTHDVTVGYEELNADQCLRQIIPGEITELPSSFELVGHLAHLNLRDECLPYRKIIGRVILDKNKVVKTVVTKIGTITNTFRTFPMEVIAGEENFDVELKQYGAIFRFNFAKVYWNSRLSDEHKRLVDRFAPSDVVVDAFCGVGPFAIPAAMRGCTVHASDLNPDSYAALTTNVNLNKVDKKVTCSNMDARAFIRKTFKEQRIVAQHIVMNLPATAIEFMDAFQKVFPSDLYSNGDMENEGEAPKKRQKTNGEAEESREGKAPLPWIHCYCFSSAEDYRTDLLDRVEKALGGKFSRDTVEIRLVRNVAPKKHMYCIHMRVPEVIGIIKV